MSLGEATEDKAYIIVMSSEAETSLKHEKGISPLLSVGRNDRKEDYLVINKQIFSKIYDGIYTKIVCDYHLPLHLPQVDKYEPAGDGNSPLATVPEFVNVKLALNLS